METISQVRDRYVSAQGLDLHYREWGNPNAPDLIVLHGLTGHAWEFDGVAERLASHFHVIALNQRGHGASDHASTYVPDVMAADVCSVAEALDLTRIRVIGHSMGGIVAILVAARRPDLVERLVVLDVGPDALESDEAQGFWRDALQYYEEATYDDPEAAVAEYLAGASGATVAPLRAFVINNLRQRQDGRWVWRFDARNLYSFVEGASESADQWNALPHVTCPTLVLRALDSGALSEESAERIVREIPDARLASIPDSGHDIHIDQPEALHAELRRFLGMD